MKMKIVKNSSLVILGLVLFFVCVVVNAAELTPVSSSVDYNTSNYSFDTYNYDSAQIVKEDKDLYFYSLISNKSKEDKYISIEVLLFDKDGKNIGIFNYCSSKDYETEFANKKIDAGESINYKGKIYSRVLASDKYKLSDVASFTIISDNEYCKIGGYDNYEGKTIDQILSTSSSKAKSGTKLDGFIDVIDKYIPIKDLQSGFSIKFVIAAAVIIICLILWVIFGKFLNKLHERMYKNKTPLAYIPIANNYLCVKMAFGPIVALVYLGILLLGILLSFVGISLVVSLSSIVLIGAFVLDIVKLISGNYDLGYLNNVKMNNTNNSNDNNMNNTQNNNVNNTMNNTTINTTDNTNTLDDVDEGNNMSNSSNNNNNQEGESDLSRFFR